MRKIRDEQLYAAIKEQVREQIRSQKQRAKETGGNEPSILLKDGKERFRGTYNDCLAKLHQLQPNSWDYAMKWGGWKIVPQQGNESVRESQIKFTVNVSGDWKQKDQIANALNVRFTGSRWSGSNVYFGQQFDVKTVMDYANKLAAKYGGRVSYYLEGTAENIREARAMEGTVHVMNLATQEKKVYSGISPEEAVIAAYAQSRGDYNTWDYQKRYGNKLVRNRLTVTAGDWSAFKDGRPLD